MHSTTIIDIELIKNNIQQYEIIENEVITCCNLKKKTISGALLRNNHFVNVTFVNCSFFGTKIENCMFTGCNFINSRFQFSNIYGTDFNGSSFDNCLWMSSNIADSALNNCRLDNKTSYCIGKGENRLKGCFQNAICGLRQLQDEYEVAA